MIGLYAIRHINTRKAYVGSSTNIKERITTHKRMLNRGNHHCSHLQRAWDKYGQNQFEFVQIGIAKNLDEARELEQAFLDMYFDDGLYNAKSAATGMPFGESNPSKKDNWHMKFLLQNTTKEERIARYGKSAGKKRDSKNYVIGAAKRLENADYTKKLSQACKGKREIVTCPHCNLSGGGGNMRRYHFDNCKKK